MLKSQSSKVRELDIVIRPSLKGRPLQQCKCVCMLLLSWSQFEIRDVQLIQPSSRAQPSECGRQHTLISVHAQTAAQQQSNGNSEARMSEKCGEWRYQFIMTLSLIHWVPLQDKGSKILCGKLEAMKITPSDCLHQEYLTINLGSTTD